MPTPTTPAQHNPRAAVRVLCVDNNRDAADSEALLLRTVGFDAVACYDGRTALDLAESFHPDVCLLDLHMPGMDGDVLARYLRDQAADDPPVLVAVTAMGDDRSRTRTAAAGFDRHFLKPLDPSEMLATLDDLQPELAAV